MIILIYVHLKCLKKSSKKTSQKLVKNSNKKCDSKSHTWDELWANFKYRRKCKHNFSLTLSLVSKVLPLNENFITFFLLFLENFLFQFFMMHEYIFFNIHIFLVLYERRKLLKWYLNFQWSFSCNFSFPPFDRVAKNLRCGEFP